MGLIRRIVRRPREWAPMNLKTAALRLEVHYQTAYRWVRSGRLVAVKVGSGYEISEAAVARLHAQRAATERMPERAEPAVPPSGAEPTIEDALHVLDLMVDALTLESAAVGERAGRVAAELLGDTAFVYRRSAADEMRAVYAAHRDPISEVAASTLGRDPRTPTNLVRRAMTTGEIICVPQVPQHVLRQRLHPELHENLHLSGCYSAVCAPIGATGTLLVTRDRPGRPYANDDLALVEAIARAWRAPTSGRGAGPRRGSCAGRWSPRFGSRSSTATASTPCSRRTAPMPSPQARCSIWNCGTSRAARRTRRS
jgi:excisionase family DNA binding protein